MKSGWFWGTSLWYDYLKAYAVTRPECLHEWKTSPLGGGQNFIRKMNITYVETTHYTQVIDLHAHKWSDIRKSYRGLINNAKRQYSFATYDFLGIGIYKKLHIAANDGQVRSDETYLHQERWLTQGCGMLMLCTDWPACYAGAYWVVYEGNAYYMSGPSILHDVQHAVIWESLQWLKKHGVRLVELGQIDGETDKEKNIGIFKQGFGGRAEPFTVVRQR